MMTPVVFALAQRARPLAEKLATSMQGDVQCPAQGADVVAAFRLGRPIVAIMAMGALVRILAPELAGKHEDAPVIAVSEDGTAIIPVIGGHHGANQLAQKIGTLLNVKPAITTASDGLLGVALDVPPAGYRLRDTGNVKAVVSHLLNGESAMVDGEAPFLAGISTSDDAKVRLTVTAEDRNADDNELIYHPLAHVLGMGCERYCDVQAAIDLAEQTIAEAGIARQSLAALATIDLKEDETALIEVAKHFGIPLRVFEAAELEEQTPRLENPSEVVFAEVGCHGVAEGAALAATGDGGVLVVPKRKSKVATAAIAQSSQVLDPNRIGRGRGRLYVVGLGPGKADWRSPEVTNMLRSATDWVGYSLYLDLAADVDPLGEKTRHDFPLGDEEKRVRHALELAGKGNDVALICSGDAGIYAMATLVFEVMDTGDVSPAAKRAEVVVSPGISALQAAAAMSGAPLGHDFCTISLSDLLTPWEAIQKRVKAAAEGDFVIAFYNPVSRRRRTQLAFARDVLLQHRPTDTPVILATSLGRPEQHVRIVPLSDLNVDDVDMLTTVVVGSSDSRVLKTGDGKERVYTPRGYSAKQGTGLKDKIV